MVHLKHPEFLVQMVQVVLQQQHLVFQVYLKLQAQMV
jgi:hypothetical protein